MGRICGLDLFHCVTDLLVRGSYSRPATLRDRAKNKISYWFYGFLAVGWRGAATHWNNYERAYLLFAALATPLVLSVHSVVSFDFAVSIIPGWHTTIFPPYFVAGAIFSGFAMVNSLAVRVVRCSVLKIYDRPPHREYEQGDLAHRHWLVTPTQPSSLSHGTAVAFTKVCVCKPSLWPVCMGVLDHDLAATSSRHSFSGRRKSARA